MLVINAAMTMQLYVKWMDIERQLRRNTPEWDLNLPPAWILRAVELEEELRTGAVVGKAKMKYRRRSY